MPPLYFSTAPFTHSDAGWSGPLARLGHSPKAANAYHPLR
jgi:hypothetical protein